MAQDPDTVADVRAMVAMLQASLPQSVDVVALGVRSKAPFQLLCTREALIWRTEELARTACDALERGDFAAAAILTRAVIENVALIWKLKDVLETRGKYDRQQLNDLLMRLLGGSKNWPEAPNPVNVLTCLEKIGKEIPGILPSYNSLSEIAHPNWHGVAALYSNNDEQSLIAYFGRGLCNAENFRRSIVSALGDSLRGFDYAYNRISDLMPAFLDDLESMWSDDVDPPNSGP